MVDGLSDPVHVSLAGVERLLATPLPYLLADLRERLESTIDSLDVGRGRVDVHAGERDALRAAIFKAKYERRKDMPVDLAEFEERLRY